MKKLLFALLFVFSFGLHSSGRGTEPLQTDCLDSTLLFRARDFGIEEGLLVSISRIGFLERHVRPFGSDRIVVEHDHRRPAPPEGYGRIAVLYLSGGQFLSIFSKNKSCTEV